MSHADRICGIFWLVFGVLVSIESYRLGLGTLYHPGPGFVFFWAAIILGIMSLVILIQAWGGKKSEESGIHYSGKLNIRKMILVMISVFLYALFMEKLGFIPITLLLFVFLLGFVEKKGWIFTIFTSIAVTCLAYLLFETWLKSQLPKGVLEFLRF